MARVHADDEESYRELQRRADRICSLIVASDYPAIDIVIGIRQLRDFAESRFPDRLVLFEMVYESRFRRLWKQFRQDSEEPLPDW